MDIYETVVLSVVSGVLTASILFVLSKFVTISNSKVTPRVLHRTVRHPVNTGKYISRLPSSQSIESDFLGPRW